MPKFILKNGSLIEFSPPEPEKFVGFGGLRCGGKTFTTGFYRLKQIDPELANFFRQAFFENLQVKDNNEGKN